MMIISPLLRVLAAAAVLFLSTPAWSAGQAPPSPVTSSQSAETGIAEARTLMRTDRFAEALAVLRRWPGAGRSRRTWFSSSAWRRSGIARAECFGGEAGCAAGRGHRLLPQHAGRAPRAAARPPESWGGRSSSRARTAWRAVLSSRSWRASRRRWSPPMSCASCRRSGRAGRAGAGTCISALRWRRTPTSASPRTRRSSISRACRSDATWTI